MEENYDYGKLQDSMLKYCFSLIKLMIEESTNDHNIMDYPFGTLMREKMQVTNNDKKHVSNLLGALVIADEFLNDIYQTSCEKEEETGIHILILNNQNAISQRIIYFKNQLLLEDFYVFTDLIIAGIDKMIKLSQSNKLNNHPLTILNNIRSSFLKIFITMSNTRINNSHKHTLENQKKLHEIIQGTNIYKIINNSGNDKLKISEKIAYVIQLFPKFQLPMINLLTEFFHTHRDPSLNVYEDPNILRADLQMTHLPLLLTNIIDNLSKSSTLTEERKRNLKIAEEDLEKNPEDSCDTIENFLEKDKVKRKNGYRISKLRINTDYKRELENYPLLNCLREGQKNNQKDLIEKISRTLVNEESDIFLSMLDSCENSDSLLEINGEKKIKDMITNFFKENENLMKEQDRDNHKKNQLDRTIHHLKKRNFHMGNMEMIQLLEKRSIESFLGFVPSDKEKLYIDTLMNTRKNAFNKKLPDLITSSLYKSMKKTENAQETAESLLKKIKEILKLDNVTENSMKWINNKEKIAQIIKEHWKNFLQQSEIAKLEPLLLKIMINPNIEAETTNEEDDKGEKWKERINTKVEAWKELGQILKTSFSSLQNFNLLGTTGLIMQNAIKRNDNKLVNMAQVGENIQNYPYMMMLVQDCFIMPNNKVDLSYEINMENLKDSLDIIGFALINLILGDGDDYKEILSNLNTFAQGCYEAHTLILTKNKDIPLNDNLINLQSTIIQQLKENFLHSFYQNNRKKDENPMDKYNYMKVITKLTGITAAELKHLVITFKLQGKIKLLEDGEKKYELILKQKQILQWLDEEKADSFLKVVNNFNSLIHLKNKKELTHKDILSILKDMEKNLENNGDKLLYVMQIRKINLKNQNPSSTKNKEKVDSIDLQEVVKIIGILLEKYSGLVDKVIEKTTAPSFSTGITIPDNIINAIQSIILDNPLKLIEFFSTDKKKCTLEEEDIDQLVDQMYLMKDIFLTPDIAKLNPLSIKDGKVIYYPQKNFISKKINEKLNKIDMGNIDNKEKLLSLINFLKFACVEYNNFIKSSVLKNMFNIISFTKKLNEEIKEVMDCINETNSVKLKEKEKIKENEKSFLEKINIFSKTKTQIKEKVEQVVEKLPLHGQKYNQAQVEKDREINRKIATFFRNLKD